MVKNTEIQTLKVIIGPRIAMLEVKVRKPSVYSKQEDGGVATSFVTVTGRVAERLRCSTSINERESRKSSSSLP